MRFPNLSKREINRKGGKWEDNKLVNERIFRLNHAYPSYKHRKIGEKLLLEVPGSAEGRIWSSPSDMFKVRASITI